MVHRSFSFWRSIPLVTKRGQKRPIHILRRSGADDDAREITAFGGCCLRHSLDWRDELNSRRASDFEETAFVLQHITYSLHIGWFYSSGGRCRAIGLFVAQPWHKAD